MCGISGCVGGREGVSSITDEQLRRLRHRGPDAAGRFERPGAVIAQNRLAIIDLVTGDPPVTNEDGTVGAVLNGEIYNFRALRDELLRDGHELRTQGDTEVIAHLAEALEPVALARRLDGMFAFAVYDASRERLVLGRDRVGKKPLYYWHGGDGTFVFASEIKGVLAHPAVPRELDPQAIPAYLTFGYVPTPHTFFAGVRSVPPGHVLVLERGTAPRMQRYWSVPLPGHDGIEQLALRGVDAAVAVRRALERAVERRLVSDVPRGAFLSGGIDSSAIVAIMARATDRPIDTFTIGFEDREGFDERLAARQVAARYATAHHEEVVAPHAVDLVEKLVWHHDQPFGDSSAVPTYLLCEITRREVTVALSGDGGDELFAGYERFAAALALRRLGVLPSAAQDVVRRVLVARGGRIGRFAAPFRLGLPDAYRTWLSFADEHLRQALLDRGAAGNGGATDDWALADYRRAWDSSAGARSLDRLLNLNLRTYLLDDLLVKADRMSMAHGLEVRSPFLDTELIELALRLDPALKLRGLSRKRVLRAAVADLLPEEILRRAKRGFGVPLDRWFREDLARYVASTVGASDARIKAHLAAGPVDALLADHRDRRGNHGQALWMLLTLEVFLRGEDW
jgi:asparagine synthase (glutamine-hydrolysing)